MRIKGLLLCVICLVGSSIIFITFTTQRPSIQTIVTETHKQLRSFQEILKDGEEKQLVTDSKYLALLGLDEQTNSPASSKNQPITVVTLLRPGNEIHIYGFIRNVTHFLPNNSVVVYGVGLSQTSMQTVRAVCNSSRCSLIQLDLHSFPAHVEDDRLHVYRPIVIQTALNTYGNILYMDSDVRIGSSKITKLFYPKSGILTWPTKHPISSLTHPKMYEYFHVTVESFFFLPLVQTSHLIIRNTKEIRDKVMLPWVQCALTRDCICPIGAQSAGCRFNKKPQYRYSGCHAYDTSAFNIVLGKYFNFDDSFYVDQNLDRFFSQLTVEKVNEEYMSILRQNNVTESIRNVMLTDRFNIS